MLKKNALNSFNALMKNSPSSLPNNSFKDSTMTTTNSLSYANVLRLLADQIDERNRIEEENKRLKEKKR